MPSIRDAARQLGGEACGKRISCPGPGHSRADRSLSVTLTDDGGFRCHSFSGDDWRLCRAHVSQLLGLPAFEPGPRRAPVVRTPRADLTGDEERAQQLAKAKRAWARSTPAPDRSVVASYLKARGLQMAPPPTLRLLSAVGDYPVSMVAAFGLPNLAAPGIYEPLRADQVRGVHITGLLPDGSARLDKIMLGSSSGWPIALVPPGDNGVLAIAEGIEEALTLHAASGLGVWAAGSEGRMPLLAPLVSSLAFVASVLIVADNDQHGTGRRCAHELARELSSTNIQVGVLDLSRELDP